MQAGYRACSNTQQSDPGGKLSFVDSSMKFFTYQNYYEIHGTPTKHAVLILKPVAAYGTILHVQHIITPPSLQVFKNRLKIHLFSSSFP